MKRFLSLLLAMLMVMSLFAGCGNNEAAAPTEPAAPAAPSSSAEPSAPATPAEPAEVAGYVSPAGNSYMREKLVMSKAKDPNSFDPFATARDGGSVPVFGLIFQKLSRVDNDGNIRYEIAKSYEQLDELTWRIEIWDCVRDSEGNALNIDDVIWSLETMISNGANFARLESVERESDYSLIWHCDMPCYDGEFASMLDTLPIISKAAYESVDGDMTRAPIGTGPYTLTDYTVGTSVLFTANEDYWMKDLPADIWEDLWVYTRQNVYQIEYQVIMDASSRAIALEMGTIDCADELAAIDVKNFADMKGIATVDIPNLTPTSMIFNCSSESPCADVNLRKAICYGINMTEIVAAADVPCKEVYGLQPTAYDAPTDWASGRDYYAGNVELAKEYLAKSNYKGEELTFMYYPNDTRAGVVVMIQSQLKALGINIKIYEAEMTVVGPLRYDATAWDLRIDNFGASVNNMTGLLEPFTTEYNIRNLNGLQLMLIEDTKLDELYAAVKADPSEGNILAWDDYFTAENCYAIALYQWSAQTACKDDVIPAVGSKTQMAPGAFTFTE